MASRQGSDASVDETMGDLEFTKFSDEIYFRGNTTFYALYHSRILSTTLLDKTWSSLAVLGNLRSSLEYGKFPQDKRWRNILGGGDRTPEHERSAEEAAHTAQNF